MDGFGCYSFLNRGRSRTPRPTSMSIIDNRCQGRMSISKRKPDSVGSDPAFERWVARQLHKMYDEVLGEEVPDELLRVVDRAAGGSGNGSGGADGKAAAERASQANHADQPKQVKRTRR